MTRWAEYVHGELVEAFPDLGAGRWNCRKISGTNTWSQHAWGNAHDLYHVDYGYTDTPAHRAYLDQVNQWISTYFDELSIRTLLWRVRNHFNHIHIDGWPKGVYVPKCHSGQGNTFKYNDGRTVAYDPGPANGIHELPDKELVTVSDAQVLKRGDAGAAVAAVQALLIGHGYDLGAWPPYEAGLPPGADGQYGADTERAIGEFQEGRDLHVTGMTDGVTLFFLQDNTSQGDHTHKDEAWFLDHMHRGTKSGKVIG